jgi:hypothetical protein
MTLVPPVSAHGTTYRTCPASDLGFDLNFVNLMVQGTTAASLPTLNGAPLGVPVNPIGTSGFSYAIKPIPGTGPHTLSVTVPFGMTV